MARLLLFILLLICFSISSNADILIDGSFEEWPANADSLADSTGDAPNAGPDFKHIRITNDAYNLYLQVEFTSAVNLRYNDLLLQMDADNNPQTGISSNGRGMDFTWDFDRNRGTSTLTSRAEIGRGNLIQRIAPDASATTHEIAISLEALPAAFTREPVHISMTEENSGDRIPDNGTELSYVVQGPLAVQPIPIDPHKDSRAIRIVSWNVLRDAALRSANVDSTSRILNALQPDIVMFQELYDTPTSTVLEFFTLNIQTVRGAVWEAARYHDCITVSRFPIQESWVSDGNIVSRHSTADSLGSDLLIANSHLPCCTNGESGRVQESLNLLDVLDARLSDPTGTPQALIIGGDLNSGGIAPELLLLCNDLIPLEMASPRHLYWHDQYTWGSSGSFWGSSRLDFLLFDKETIFRDKAFILDTDTLPSEALEEMHLEAADTFISDHLPLVFDIRSPHLPALLQTDRMEADGSATSEWLGNINAIDYPYVQTVPFGWIHLFETQEGFWFKPNGMGWHYTEPGTYPWTWTALPPE